MIWVATIVYAYVYLVGFLMACTILADLEQKVRRLGGRSTPSWFFAVFVLAWPIMFPYVAFKGRRKR